MPKRFSLIRFVWINALCALALLCAVGASAQDGTSPSKKATTSKTSKSATSKTSKKTTAKATHKPAAKTSASHTASSHAANSHATSAKSKSASGKRVSSRKRRKTARGQQKIDSERAQEIQEALIREHYLTGTASGTWTQSSEDAMRRYQADHGWQTKEVPDSRALISLGLGPSKDRLLNPESAMTTSPAKLQSSGAAPTSHTPAPQSTSPAPVSSQSPLTPAKSAADAPEAEHSDASSPQ